MKVRPDELTFAAEIGAVPMVSGLNRCKVNDGGTNE